MFKKAEVTKGKFVKKSQQQQTQSKARTNHAKHYANIDKLYRSVLANQPITVDETILS